MSSHDFAVGGDRTKFAAGTMQWAAAAMVLLLVAHVLDSNVEHSDGIEFALLLLSEALQTGAGVAIVVWMHRAYSNLSPLRAVSRYSPAAAVAFFFLPLVSFFLPQTILQEIWIMSRPEDPRAVSGVYEPRPPRFELWWYLFLAWVAAFNIAAVCVFEGKPATVTLALAAVLAVLVAWLGTDLVRRVDERQKMRLTLFSIRRDTLPAAPTSSVPVSAAVAALPPVKAQVTAPARKASLLRDLFMPIVTSLDEEQPPEPKLPPPPARRPAPPIRPAPIIAREGARLPEPKVAPPAIEPSVPVPQASVAAPDDRQAPETGLPPTPVRNQATSVQPRSITLPRPTRPLALPRLLDDTLLPAGLLPVFRLLQLSCLIQVVFCSTLVAVTDRMMRLIMTSPSFKVFEYVAGAHYVLLILATIEYLRLRRCLPENRQTPDEEYALAGIKDSLLPVAKSLPLAFAFFLFGRIGIDLWVVASIFVFLAASEITGAVVSVRRVRMRQLRTRGALSGAERSPLPTPR